MVEPLGYQKLYQNIGTIVFIMQKYFQKKADVSMFQAK